VADVISKALTCRDCGRAFEHASRSNKPKLLCAGCLKESQRKATREYKRRQRAASKKVPQRTACTDCGKPFPRPVHRTLRCADCKAEVARQYQRKLRVSNPKPQSQYRCVACRQQIVRRGRSGRPLYCASCGRAAFLLARRRNDCANWHKRRAAKRAVTAESFRREEIYERDRWKCGICRRRIDRRLRHPHPMSVSLDHVIPLALGGPHTRANVQAAHLRCNLRKRTRAVGEQMLLFG
jgi:hypothetical protein